MTLNVNTAASLMAMLGNTTRLQVVRLLVRAGPNGMAVGEIQRALGVPGSTLSHHLSHLRHAGLIWQEREGPLLRCCVSYDLIDAIVSFLTDECCVGHSSEAGRKQAVE